MPLSTDIALSLANKNDQYHHNLSQNPERDFLSFSILVKDF